MTELERYIQTYFGIGEADLSTISTFFKPFQLRKGDFFLKPGRPCERLAFVQQGYVREYVPAGDKEVTKWISAKGHFVADFSGFVFQQPGRWYIQAITDSELYGIDQADYRRIGALVPGWAQLEKLFIARCFSVLEERVVSLLALSAEERFAQLFDNNKKLFNEVPLQYLASMMGMSPETLSRLRKKQATGSS